MELSREGQGTGHQENRDSDGVLGTVTLRKEKRKQGRESKKEKEVIEAEQRTVEPYRSPRIPMSPQYLPQRCSVPPLCLCDHYRSPQYSSEPPSSLGSPNNKGTAPLPWHAEGRRSCRGAQETTPKWGSSTGLHDTFPPCTHSLGLDQVPHGPAARESLQPQPHPLPCSCTQLSMV